MLFDRPFWVVLLSIAILGTALWLDIFEHNYHPRMYGYNDDVTILRIGHSDLDLNHPKAAFTI